MSTSTVPPTELDSQQRLETWDIVVVAVYFAVVIGVGVFAMCRAARGTVSGYFLAGRSMLWLPVGASLFVSNIGTEHFIGLSGSGAASGIGVGAWELNALMLLQLLGWVFVPVYIACMTYTMPEYLSKRFGGQRLRVYFALLSLLLYIFTKCSVDLYTGALFIKQSLGWDLYLCIIILIGVTAVLTITGGLTAVIYTDTLQCAVMLIGAIILMALSFSRIGGFDGLWQQYPLAAPKNTTTCDGVPVSGLPPDNWNVMLRDANDPEMPWVGFLLGQTPGSIWYWCTDQVIVQRALAAKSLSHAKGATLLAGFIKILPLFVMVMPGMISRVLFPDTVACQVPSECMAVCQSEAGCSSIAYPKLVLEIMPTGLRGLMMAAMIAALMSDLDSIMNSASTLFTIDIYKRVRKRASIRELMVVGRVFIVVMTGVAVAWVPVVKEQQGGQIFLYIQEITNYLAPPIAAAFIMAILIPRVNEQGTFWGLVAGFVVGIIRMALIFIYRPPGPCEPDTRPKMLTDFHYMYFAMLLFWVTVLVTLLVSMFTKETEEWRLIRTTFWTRHDPRDPAAVRKEAGEKRGDIVSPDDVAMGEIGGGLHKGDEGDVDLEGEQSGARESDSSGCVGKVCGFVCGTRVTDADLEKQESLRRHMMKMSSLKQGRVSNALLNVGLVVIMSLGIFLYVWWSIWSPTYDPWN